MTIAIKRGNGDLIWFDAVTSFSRQLTGTVSKHPLETGAVVTDHTTIDNEVIQMSAVLSDFDFNLHRPVINPQDAFLLGLTNKQFVNNTPITSVDGTEGSLYNNIIIEEAPGIAENLPESVGQFFGSNAPTVRLDSRTPAKVKPALSVQEDLMTMFNMREEFALLSFYEETLRETITNCVMTSLNFAEDPETGEAVYPVMTIERVRYATSASVRVRTRVSPDVEDKAAPQQNLGKQATAGTSTESDVPDPDKPMDASQRNASQFVELGEAAQTP